MLILWKTDEKQQRAVSLLFNGVAAWRIAKRRWIYVGRGHLLQIHFMFEMPQTETLAHIGPAERPEDGKRMKCRWVAELCRCWVALGILFFSSVQENDSQIRLTPESTPLETQQSCTGRLWGACCLLQRFLFRAVHFRTSMTARI